jgi:hypothetical protein
MPGISLGGFLESMFGISDFFHLDSESRAGTAAKVNSKTQRRGYLPAKASSQLTVNFGDGNELIGSDRARLSA